jgi:putative tricarboxylic transport membrane protein
MIDAGLLFHQFLEILTPARLLMLTGFSFLGLLCGAMPGISSTMTISLLVSLTYRMSPFNGILVLIAAYTASTYGGSLSATLLNVPGTPAAAATVLEAYPMALRGEAGRAIGISTLQSFTGGIFGTLILLFSAPLVAELALKFGPWEYFWFSIFGIFVCANLSGGSTIKGLIAGIFGILLSLIGVDPLHGILRYTFGITQIEGGISYIPALIGLYGVAEALSEFIKTTEGRAIKGKGSVLPPFHEYIRGMWLTIKVTFLGFLIGALPGTGANIAAWVGYDHAKRVSKHPETFGKGNPEGIVGSETANNACCAGVYLPLLTLAIPGDATTAIVLGMMLVHGLRPGPSMWIEQPHWIYAVVAIHFVSNIMFALQGFSVAKPLSKILELPRRAIMTVVIILCTIGSYAVNSNMFDVYLSFLFGILGLFMRRFGFDVAPLVLGMVLGDLIDVQFRRAILTSSYSFLPFFTRPICIILIFILIYLALKEIPFFRNRLTFLSKRDKSA